MRGLSYLRAAGAAFFIALAAYAAAAGTELAERPATVTAEFVSLSESVRAEGTVLREEIPVLGRGRVKLCASDGERVARGAVVATQGKKEVTAPQAGFFTSELSPDNAVGRVVSSLSWEFETKLPSRDGDKINEGDAVTLRTPYGDFAAVTVSKKGRCVRFRAHSGIEKMLCVDSLEAEIVFAEHSGYRVPASAVCHDADGDYVTALAGDRQKRVAVSECFAFDDNCLVKGEIRQGMEILY